VFYNISGKRWLQASPYMYRGLHNAIMGRFEKYNVLIGVVLLITAIGFLASSLVWTVNRLLINKEFDPSIVILVAVVVSVLITIAAHQLGLRGSHRRLIDNFTKRKDQYRRLIPENDVVFRSIMFPAYDDYLTGRKRVDIDAKAWKILESYVRKVLNEEDIVRMEREDLDCSPVEEINLDHQYEAFVLYNARLAGTQIAGMLGLDVGTFFDDRLHDLVQKYQDRLTALIEQLEATINEARVILGTPS
jgi:hypothetical protein